MSLTVTSNDGSQYQKPTTMATVGGVLAGGTLQGVITSANDTCAFPLLGKIRKLSESVDKVEISDALKSAIEKGGIKDKVELVELTAEHDYKNIGQFFKGFFEKFKSGKGSVLDIMCLQQDMIKEGFNAGFANNLDQILINTEKMGLAGFHEVGHAINFHNSAFWKSMQKYRVLAVPLAGILSLTALLKRKKLEGEEPVGTFDKVTTFIKENVGKLTLLTMAPVVAEEVKATLRGNKLAKEILSPEMYKKVKITNRYGAITYVGAALLVSAGAYIANKVKDSITKPKLIQKEA